VIAAFASVEDDAERSAALEREFLEFVKGANVGSADGPTELRFEYLLVLARNRAKGPPDAVACARRSFQTA
jgi:hypothetical protein